MPPRGRGHRPAPAHRPLVAGLLRTLRETVQALPATALATGRPGNA